jgi:hypothetical protein
MLRSSMRTLFAETGAYNLDRSGTNFVAGVVTQIPGVTTNDVGGHWFSASAYTLDSVDATHFVIKCVGGSPNTSPLASDVTGLTVTLDQNGAFVRTGY